MRVHNWPHALHEYLEAVRSREFAYGAFDCCLFAADWVQIATGIDHAAELRGYASKAQAYEIIERYGSIEAMVTQLLEREPIHPAHAQRGDIVLASVPVAQGEAGETIGICEGVHSHFPCARGCVQFRTLRARIAWRI